MNFLGFVLSLLLIISFGILSLNETTWCDHRLRITYLGHVHASRKLLDSYQQQIFSALPSNPKKETTDKKTTNTKSSVKPKVKVNPECARFNLWPLTQGPDSLLQAKALQLLQTFYGPYLFQDDPSELGLFFKEFLAKLQEEKGKIPLEKLRFEPALQKKYYAMLKGCRHFEPEQEIGYPSFLEIFKVDKIQSKICLAHAHLGMCLALFGSKNGAHLHQVLQGEQWEAKETEIQQILEKAALVDFVYIGKGSHPKNSTVTLVAEDLDVVLRKTIYRNNASAL